MLSKSALKDILGQVGVTVNGTKPYDIHVHNPELYKKMMVEPSIAAGEGYMKRWWDCEKLDELFFRICRYNLDEKIYYKWHMVLSFVMNKIMNFQTPLKSKEVAEKHYNLGNTFYSYMLGPSMAYTCAYWKNANNLDQAQFDKFDLVCRKIDLKPGERVLELGCGWGGLAKYMAEKYGCIVDAVNISTEQVNFAKESCKGLPVTIHLCDYRDSQVYNPQKKLYDKVVSVGLCEHIGHKNYKSFIKLARDNIKEEGLFLLHTIGKNFSNAYVDPWTEKYIFPNGILPTVKLLGEAFEGHFILEDFHNFGADYDKTLMAWHKNFNENWKKHLASKFDDTFFRLWNYYLLTNAGAFRSRSLQLWQMVLSPKGILGGYDTVR